MTRALEDRSRQQLLVNRAQTLLCHANSVYSSSSVRLVLSLHAGNEP